MTDRDWDKELAKIDRQLASLPDEALAGAHVPQAAAGPAAGRGGAPGAAGGAAPAVRGAAATSGWAVYARLGLSVALGVAMVFWPYQARCGPGLAMYLAAVGAVLASGVWSAVWTWRHRAARAHSLALLIVLWGLVLGSLEVLPRVGYAVPTLAHPATWACQ